MGCDELGIQVRDLGSSTHVFGHSHINVDEVIGKTRFLQCSLGYPWERNAFTKSGPIRVWPPVKIGHVDGMVDCLTESVERCHVG